MTERFIRNTTNSALVLPNGATIPAKGVVRVEWEKEAESNDVVKAWFLSKALEFVKDENDVEEEEVQEAPVPAPAVDANRTDSDDAAKLTGASAHPIGATAAETGSTDTKPWAAADEGASKADAAKNLKKK